MKSIEHTHVLFIENQWSILQKQRTYLRGRPPIGSFIASSVLLGQVKMVTAALQQKTYGFARAGCPHLLGQLPAQMCMELSKYM